MYASPSRPSRPSRLPVSVSVHVGAPIDVAWSALTVWDPPFVPRWSRPDVWFVAQDASTVPLTALVAPAWPVVRPLVEAGVGAVRRRLARLVERGELPTADQRPPSSPPAASR